LKSAETKQGVETGRKLDYGETSDLFQGFFAWKPNRLSAVLVRALSWVMRL